MNIKSIPNSQGVGSVKESTEDQRQGAGRDSDRKKSVQETVAENLAASETVTPEAADADLLASQPVDSETVVRLLARKPKTPRVVKFPTFLAPKPPGKPVKKLNRSA